MEECGLAQYEAEVVCERFGSGEDKSGFDWWAGSQGPEAAAWSDFLSQNLLSLVSMSTSRHDICPFFHNSRMCSGGHGIGEDYIKVSKKSRRTA